MYTYLLMSNTYRHNAYSQHKYKKNYILIFITSFISTLSTAATCHVLIKIESNPFKMAGQKEGCLEK